MCSIEMSLVFVISYLVEMSGEYTSKYSMLGYESYNVENFLGESLFGFAITYSLFILAFDPIEMPIVIDDSTIITCKAFKAMVYSNLCPYG